MVLLLRIAAYGYMYLRCWCWLGDKLRQAYDAVNATGICYDWCGGAADAEATRRAKAPCHVHVTWSLDRSPAMTCPVKCVGCVRHAMDLCGPARRSSTASQRASGLMTRYMTRHIARCLSYDPSIRTVTESLTTAMLGIWPDIPSPACDF